MQSAPSLNGAAGAVKARQLCAECEICDWASCLVYNLRPWASIKAPPDEKLAARASLSAIEEFLKTQGADSRTRCHERILGRYSSLSARADTCSLCKLIVQAVNVLNLENQFQGANITIAAKCTCRLLYRDVEDQRHPNAHDLPVLDIFAAEQARNPTDPAKVKCIGVPLSFTLHDDGLFPLRLFPVQWSLDTRPRIPVARRTITNGQIHPEMIRFWLADDEGINITTYPNCFRLIDVLHDEVVRPPRDTPYLALSYVWGGLKQQTAKSADFIPSDSPTDHRYGTEYLPLDRVSLPRTIQDAMQLVEAIGERYLWVDALCIMQDNEKELHQTLRDMPRIYSSALATIVAASGKDANHGLPGVRPNSRQVTSVVGVVDGVPLTLVEPLPTIAETTWAKRAWTFQEAFFSRRWVVFWEDRVVFCRSDGTMSTEARPQLNLLDDFRPSLLTIHAIIDTRDDEYLWKEFFFNDYIRKVTEFTRRELTFEHDIVHAFAGVMADYDLAESPTKSCALLLARSKQMFMRALLWTAASPNPHRRRRDPKLLQNPQGNPSQQFFPSWSWIGWVTPVVWEHPVDDTSGGEYANRKLTLYSEIDWLQVLADSLQQQPNQDCLFREPEILKFYARVAECEGGNVGLYYVLLGDLEREPWGWAGVPLRRFVCLILQLEDGGLYYTRTGVAFLDNRRRAGLQWEWQTVRLV